MTPPKDEVLAGLAEQVNVAQFVSLGPGPSPTLRFVRLRGLAFDESFGQARDALAALFAHFGDLLRRAGIPSRLEA